MVASGYAQTQLQFTFKLVPLTRAEVAGSVGSTRLAFERGQATQVWRYLGGGIGRTRRGAAPQAQLGRSGREVPFTVRVRIGAY